MKKILCLILLTISVATFAQIPKPLPNTFVNDYAEVLDKAEIKKLNKKINIIEKRAGIQLAIVLVDTLPENYEIEDFSLLIGRKWGVGKNNDGLVYVASISQRKQRLEVARNSEAKFTEARSLDILNEIKPYFRNEEYYAGLNKLVEEIAYDLDVDFEATAQQGAVKTAEKDGEWYEILGGLVILLGPFALFYYIRKRRERKRLMQHGIYPDYGGGGYGASPAPRRYSPRPYSSSGSRLGSFAAGAATGYLANELMDKLCDKEKEEQDEEKRQREQEEYEARHREDDESDYGNWGGGRSGGSRSSNSGFSGGGATSDW